MASIHVTAKVIGSGRQIKNTTNVRLLLMLIFGLLTFHVVASTNEISLVADYMPYSNGHEFPRMPVIVYVESLSPKSQSNIWMHPSAPKKFPTVQEISDEDSDFATIVLRLPNGTVFKTYNAFVLGPGVGAVYSGDFNHDGIPDFMIYKPGSGNGLGGEECFGVFAFSEGKTYRFTRIRNWGLGPQNLILDPKTKNFRLIQTSFRQATGTDGLDHSFWVHRFYEWDGFKFRGDSNLEPVWIQYLNRPNHEPTKLLTPTLQQKAWAEVSYSDFDIEW